jgi:Uncharacterised protein conserved in bacteria (DUF2313)
VTARVGIPPEITDQLGHPLSDMGDKILSHLPPYFWEDAMVLQTIDAVGRELARLESRMLDVRHRLYPQNSDDRYGILGMWEDLLGLPVNPSEVAVEDRRAAVLAHVRTRRQPSGAEWVATMSTLLGGGWTHQEGPGDYTVTILIPYDPASYTTGRTRDLARRITPAHLVIEVGFLGGFLVELSDVGDVL